MHYQWNFSFLLQQGDDGVSYIASILHGAVLTIGLATLAYVIALLLGTGVGTLARTKNKLTYGFAYLYLNLFRNIPLIVQLFIWFFVLPELLPEAIGDYIKQNISPATISVICMSFYISSRIGIQITTGIDSVPKGLIQSGRSLGMTTLQMLRHIIYPLAFRTIYPTLISEATNAPKNVAVCYSIGVLELYFQYKQVLERTSQAIELIVIVTALYFLISILSVLIMLAIKKALHLNPWR